jgi:hypothetical protein
VMGMMICLPGVSDSLTLCLACVGVHQLAIVGEVPDLFASDAPLRAR